MGRQSKQLKMGRHVRGGRSNRNLLERNFRDPVTSTDFKAIDISKLLQLQESIGVIEVNKECKILLQNVMNEEQNLMSMTRVIRRQLRKRPATTFQLEFLSYHKITHDTNITNEEARQLIKQYLNN